MFQPEIRNRPVPSDAAETRLPIAVSINYNIFNSLQAKRSMASEPNCRAIRGRAREVHVRAIWCVVSHAAFMPPSHHESA
jgi:hypothetical protein